MNRQRKVVITITYNEMGIIIDTKAEEVAQPNLQSTCNQLATDCISRQAAIDAVDKYIDQFDCLDVNFLDGLKTTKKILNDLPSAQPEQLERCPIYGGVCGYPSDQCYDCPRHYGAQSEQRSFSCDQENDAISRQAAIDALGEEPYVWEEDDDFARGMRFQWKSDHDAIETLPSAQPTLREQALVLLLNWAVECGFGYDNFPEEYERYKDEIEDMSYFDGMIYIAEKEVERNDKG